MLKKKNKCALGERPHNTHFMKLQTPCKALPHLSFTISLNWPPTPPPPHQPHSNSTTFLWFPTHGRSSSQVGACELLSLSPETVFIWMSTWLTPPHPPPLNWDVPGHLSKLHTHTHTHTHTPVHTYTFLITIPCYVFFPNTINWILLSNSVIFCLPT